MKNIKNIKNNYYIIFGLLVIFFVVLNYNNLINFFKIKEGAEGAEGTERTVEVIQQEITAAYNALFTDAQNGSTEKIKFKDIISDDILKGKIKKLFSLNIELIIRNEKDTYSEYKTEGENKEFTYSEFKTILQASLPSLGLSGIILKIYKDLDLDLINELNSLTDTSTSIQNANPLSLKNIK